jgi:Lrp/AsnC family transcriptional regulator for asnA, asnC and gidA
MSNYQIDRIDQKILSFLVKNARMPFLEIARECGVSGAAIHQRVKRLESNGVITGSRLLVKAQALGLNVCAFVSVSLSEANKYPDVIESFKRISEIVECHFVTGKHAILIKLYCFDHDHLMEILLNTIQKIPYVQSTDTQISLDQAIERQVWVKDYQNTSFSATVRKNKLKAAKEQHKEHKE